MFPLGSATRAPSVDVLKVAAVPSPSVVPIVLLPAMIADVLVAVVYFQMSPPAPLL